VLSTDEPIRAFQQLATAAAIAPGRIEVVADRGSSAITFSMIDLDERDYDMLSAQRWICCSRLIAKSASPGTARTADVLSSTCSWYPGKRSQCASGLAPGGSPESVLRAANLGLPMLLGILSGTPEHWRKIGRPMRAPAGRETDLEPGMVFAGGSDEVAARVLNLHKLLGPSRQILQMDVGAMPHQTFLRSIELLGREVLPRIRKALGA
jgi:alkanesulfonate monooxygenase SsuD/methylene tetrahydromethanopterin reductase-like flavin-dependent oxidoreductase (luciferase family)